MIITSSLTFESNIVVFEASSSLSIGLEDNTVSFEMASDVTTQSESYSYGITMLPKICSLGGDIQLTGYGGGSVTLPAIYSTGDGGMFVPEAIQRGEGKIQPLYSTGLMRTSQSGSGSNELPSLVSTGGEGHYGFGEVSLPALRSYGSSGSAVTSVMSTTIIYSGFAGYYETIVFINSTGQVVDTISGTREVIQEILDSITATDSYSTLGEFLVSISETINGEMYITAAISDGTIIAPVLDSSARVWVVNLDTGTSGQYENFGYNSFIERDGVSYGVAEDGIYELGGDTDNGVPIDSLIEIGLSNFDNTKVKTVPNVYVGVSSDNVMILKAEADGQTYFYEARSNSDAIKNNRVDLGKGLKGNYWNFTLLNKEGGDFDLASIAFSPISTSRKI